MPEIANPTVVDLTELVDGGFGTISRATKLAEHADNPELADKAEAAIIGGEFLVETSVADLTRCGDGRSPETNNGGNQIFGGTPGLVKTAIISGLVDADAPVNEVIAGVVANRKEQDVASGGHRADTHGNPGCGCGECDGAQIALERYLEHEEILKPLVTGLWGVLGLTEKYGDFSESDYAASIESIGELVAKQYFADGPAQVMAVEEVVGAERVEDLIGGHKEVLWVINGVRGTKFNQSAFAEKFDSFDDEGKGIQAFWEDQWAIEDELAAMTDAPEELRKALTADLIRRVATAANLTNADLKIVSIR